MFAIYEARRILGGNAGVQDGVTYRLFHYLRVVLFVNVRRRSLVESTEGCISYLCWETVFPAFRPSITEAVRYSERELTNPAGRFGRHS